MVKVGSSLLVGRDGAPRRAWLETLVGEIAAGRWKEGDLVPSEQALGRQFGASRMTVNRAVRELTAQQVLTRRQGAGTYVAPQKYQATLVEIRNIADEVRARGHLHASRPQLLEQAEADEAAAWSGGGRHGDGPLAAGAVGQSASETRMIMERDSTR